MKTLVALAVLLSSIVAAAAPPPAASGVAIPAVPTPRFLGHIEPAILGRKSYAVWVAAAGELSPIPTKAQGGSARVGFEYSIYGAELAFHYQKAQFRAVVPQADPSAVAATDASSVLVDPDAEINRPRLATDPWTVMLIDPGVLLHGRISPDSLRGLSETARFGVAYARMTDQVNSRSFSGWLLTFDAGVHYLVSSRVPLTLDLGFGIRFGNVSRAEEGANHGSQLPVFMGSMSAGVSYWY